VTREHSPRPGRTWETAIVRTEVIVPDESYGCRYCSIELGSHGNRYHHRVGLHTWQAPADESLPVPNTSYTSTPEPPSPNCETRRALARAKRKATR
jgi:hypothetical protein